MMLPEPLTAYLRALAQTRRLTLNVLIQGAWALALARQAGADGDVLFGMMTSGRPADLPGMEQIVGLCTNILPRRIRLAPSMQVIDWLTNMQARQAEEQDHGRCLLSDLQRWSGVPADEALFDSVVVFENYPVAATLENDAADRTTDIKVTGFASFEQGIDFPLCLVVAPGRRMDFRLIFSCQRFDATATGRLLDHVIHVLSAIAADPERRLATLWPGPTAGAANNPWENDGRKRMVGRP
jgi:non-ribosomal peptide synthetase component F